MTDNVVYKSDTAVVDNRLIKDEDGGEGVRSWVGSLLEGGVLRIGQVRVR